MNFILNRYKIKLLLWVGMFCFTSLALSAGKEKSTLQLTPINQIKKEILKTEKERVIQLADSFLQDKPETVTAHACPRSAGGVHDYYSEATYWWPDPANPSGPYIRKDGINNPDNFDYHRQAISLFSWVTGTLTSAYLLTGESIYAQTAVKHLQAWFIDPVTRMNPNMLYTQAIKGVNTGRGIGIIDAIPFIEVTKSIQILEKSPYLSGNDRQAIHEWFRTFMYWMNTHKYGIDEMNAKNNHGTWWHAQVAAYATFVGDTTILEKCLNHYRDVLLPTQMGKDGSFPLEIERTKPYSYSLFNLDGMATLAWILTNGGLNGWDFTLTDGRNMKKGVDYIKPYVMNKNIWPFPKDISHWEEQPGRRPFMFFAALIQQQSEWVSIWKSCSPNFPSDESKRNMPIKNPILWLGITKPIK